MIKVHEHYMKDIHPNFKNVLHVFDISLYQELLAYWQREGREEKKDKDVKCHPPISVYSLHEFIPERM